MEVINAENPSLLHEMRLSRESANAVFVKFTNNNKFYNTHAFCFYEGEDGKYYDPRIRSYFGANFITYTVGNKKEVLKLLSKIKHEGIYNDVCKMFFIDRDFEDSLKDYDEDLYETPCYSIENLYAQKVCFKQILQSEFGINVTNENFEKCIIDFDKRFDEFNQSILEFNALVLLRRKRSDSNSNVQFGSIKTSHLIEVSISNIKKSHQYNDTIDNIKNKLAVNNGEIQTVQDELCARNNFVNDFRGKNQLDFMVAVILSLKALNRKSEYFTIPLRCVNINITSNRLSELSQYALTPPCLITFLEKHTKK